MGYQPPFQLTHTMMRHVARIGELIGTWKAANQNRLVPELRRGNRIKTIQASLAVEQNTLTLEQVTAVLAGKTCWVYPKRSRRCAMPLPLMKQWSSGTRIRSTTYWPHMPYCCMA